LTSWAASGRRADAAAAAGAGSIDYVIAAYNNFETIKVGRADRQLFGLVVDLALDATDADGNAILSSSNGYQRFFNDPASSTFHPGADPGAPGLVVLLSSTPTKPGMPLQGPDTNLAGLFQLNGVAKVGGLAESWNTWQVGKPVFGTGHATLTAYVVRGTAPTVVSPDTKPISNVVRVPFTIAR
jgi:hypothetical protein